MKQKKLLFVQASTEAVRQNGFVHRGADVISATVILERTGWVLGERIPLRARVDNFCETMAVRETRFALQKVGGKAVQLLEKEIRLGCVALHNIR